METTQDTPWLVRFSSKAAKQASKLPAQMNDILLTLIAELAVEGPVQAEWHHYGKLEGAKDVHHCHLNKGKPRYVAVWKVVDREVQIMEVQYAGTHEKVNYKTFK